MDTSLLLFIIVLIILAVISLFFGIKFLIKYNQTRNKWHLFLGVLLTFVIPAILFYIASKAYVSTMMVYGPPSPINNASMAYGPQPIVAYGPPPV